MEYITLKNKHLQVKVACCPQAVYDSSRFDWTGFMPEIFYKGVAFGAAEFPQPADPMANGRGLCNEFRVPHYAAETPAGEAFLKPGIGLLTQRDDGPDWKFDHRYAVSPFSISQIYGTDYVSYCVEGKPWKDICLQEYKLLRLVGDTIVETITLDNTGTADFHCVDYNHNFLTIGTTPMGPLYRIEMPGYTAEEMAADITEGGLIVKDGQYTWNAPCTEAARTMSRHGLRSSDTYVWAMYNDELRLGVREYVDIPYEEFCIWAAPHVCTCKVLAPVSVPAGTSKTWTRRWEFVDLTK